MTKVDEKAKAILVAWLKGKGEQMDYWLLSDTELDKHLARFWFEACQTDGNKYRTSSLSHLRYRINRCLKKDGHESDIIQDSEYIRSQTTFKEACTELRNLGYGYRTSYEEIIASGQTL